MSQKGKMLQAIVVGVVLAAAIIGGVTLTQQSFFGSQSTESRTTSPVSATGILAAQITDPPNVPEGVTHVYVSYSDVQVHAAGVANNSGWYTIASSGTVDLMSVVNVSMTLGSAPVSIGLFTVVKFDIASASITYFGQNDSAVVPLNQISVPISNGGVYVSANGSAGFLIVISPTVVPFQNGTQTSFVLVPSATSLPISSNVWNKGLESRGSIIDVNSTVWLHSSDQSKLQNISIVQASLTQSSLNLIVTNTGNVNTTLTSISILEAQALGTAGEGSSGHLVGEYSFTIAVFQILSNGTVIQPNHSEDHRGEDYNGLTLQAGQSVNLSYQGSIMTLTLGDSISGSTSNAQIVAGQPYLIKVAASFGTSATYIVHATAS